MRLLTLISTLLLSTQIWAWGERGHHIVGEAAARMVDSDMAKHPEFKKLGRFYKNRALQMGHLNNIPDISWKSQKDKVIKEHNGPTHYVDIEHFFGFPKSTKDKALLEKIRNLDPDFEKVRKKYDGKKHPTKKRPLNVYKDTGTNPWRVGELFERSKVLMKCASERSGSSFTNPLFPLNGRMIVEDTKCKKNTGQLEALLGSTVIMGLMGHFVADLGQPQHVSADPNGWMTNQGGLHSYFETELVQAQTDELMSLVSLRAEELKSNGNFTKRLGKDWRSLGATQLMFRLMADSYSNLDKLRELDRKHSLLEESRNSDGKNAKVTAKRKDAYDPEVYAKFTDFIVDRMAMSTAVLAHLWGQVWLEGGRPDIANIVFYTKPYPLDSAFILPDYR